VSPAQSAPSATTRPGEIMMYGQTLVHETGAKLLGVATSPRLPKSASARLTRPSGFLARCGGPFFLSGELPAATQESICGCGCRYRWHEITNRPPLASAPTNAANEHLTRHDVVSCSIQSVDHCCSRCATIDSAPPGSIAGDAERQIPDNPRSRHA
jgi:hypothetical protein